MVTWSQFTCHALKMRGHMPDSKWRPIVADAKARLHARYPEGRADSVLDFSDLSAKFENIVGGF